MKHTCIKPACNNSYEDKEPEAYYCPSCREANKILAKQVDAQMASRPKKNTMSPLQEYEAAQKISVGGMQGMHVKI